MVALGLHMHVIALIFVLWQAFALLTASRDAKAQDMQPPPDASSKPCQLGQEQEAAVLGVIPPQTLRLSDGRFVRLAEILVPNKTGAGDTFDPSAQALAEISKLSVGAYTRIGFEARTRDRYGVYLAQVFAGTEHVWLQERLVSLGLALAYPQPDNHACFEALSKAEEKARADRKGLWGLALFQVRNASDAAGLLNLQQTYQIVEGEVKRVTKTTVSLTLAFGDETEKGFAAVLSGPAKKKFGAKAETALKGVRIRVRGFIERRRGPFISVSQPEQIELLSLPRKQGRESGEETAPELPDEGRESREGVRDQPALNRNRLKADKLIDN